MESKNPKLPIKSRAARASKKSQKAISTNTAKNVDKINQQIQQLELQKKKLIEADTGISEKVDSLSAAKIRLIIQKLKNKFKIDIEKAKYYVVLSKVRNANPTKSIMIDGKVVVTSLQNDKELKAYKDQHKKLFDMAIIENDSKGTTKMKIIDWAITNLPEFKMYKTK